MRRLHPPPSAAATALIISFLRVLAATAAASTAATAATAASAAEAASAVRVPSLSHSLSHSAWRRRRPWNWRRRRHTRTEGRASGGTKEGVEGEGERHEAASSNFFWGNTGGGGYTVSEGGRERGRESPDRPTAERAPPISRPPPPSPPKQREASARAPQAEATEAAEARLGPNRQRSTPYQVHWPFPKHEQN